MSRCVGFNSLDLVAVIDDAPGGGNLTDPNAPRNLPAIDPLNWLSKVKLHSSFDYYQLHDAVQNVSINHASVAGFTSVDQGGLGVHLYYTGQFVQENHTLFTHNLGYVPRYFVAFNGAVMANGMMVQVEGVDGRCRVMSTYATSSIIGLQGVGYATDQTLAAAALTYEVMVFEEPTITPSLPLLSREAGEVQFGRGAISSANSYLRKVAPADSSFDIDLNPTIDWNNGRTRVVSGGNVYTQGGYNGSFAGPAFIPVGGIL